MDSQRLVLGGNRLEIGFPVVKLAYQGRTVVMVTHDPRAAAYADRVVFLADGKIVGELESPTADTVLEQMKKLGD